VKTRLARAAVAYVTQLGWPVFPLAARGKLPMIPKNQGGNGHLDATTDIEQVKEWWTRWPHANIGIAADARSGLLVVDIDPRNGGDEELAALEAKHGRLPDTIEALTGGGGRHLIYERPADLKFRAKLADGIDIKSDGYIVAPPSIHPSGTPYVWEASGRPLETELAVLPPWVLQRIIQFEPEPEYGQAVDDAASSFLALAFSHAGWLGSRIDKFRINVLCPWEDQHTQKSGSGGTVIFAPRQGSGAGWFHCAHTSHGKKTMRDVIAALPFEAIRAANYDVCMQVAKAAGADDYELAERDAIQMENDL
jgi:hypothetical protein